MSLIVTTASATYMLSDCISMRFEKERYTPYTLLEGQWYAPNIIPSEIISVRLILGNKGIHYGYPCSAQITYKDGKQILKLRSRGYTDALSRNQPTAGLVPNVTLDLLATSAIVCPNVGYEANTPEVNYVNYYDGTSIWDAIICYSIRAYGLYPYIRGANTVRISRPSDMGIIVIPTSSLIQKGTGTDYSNLICAISESDITGEANAFNVFDDFAASRNIIRKREITFDREWIMDPELGLKMRIDRSKRGVNYDFFTVLGYPEADLLDQLVISELNYVGEISKIQITASQEQPLTTQIYCYHDAYCA